MKKITIDQLKILNDKKSFDKIVLWLTDKDNSFFSADELADIKKLHVTGARFYQEEDREYWRFFYKKLVLELAPDKRPSAEGKEWTAAFCHLSHVWEVFTSASNTQILEASTVPKKVTKEDVEKYIRDGSKISREKVQPVYGNAEETSLTAEENDLEFALSTMLTTAAVWTSLVGEKGSHSEKIFAGITVGFGELDDYAIRACERESATLCLSFLIPENIKYEQHQCYNKLKAFGFTILPRSLRLESPDGKQPFRCTLAMSEFESQPDLSKQIIQWADKKKADYLQQIGQLLSQNTEKPKQDQPIPRIDSSSSRPRNRLLTFLSGKWKGYRGNDDNPPPSPKL